MAAPAAQSAILICGLGKLGQACLQRLQRFDVALLALDRHSPDWRQPALESCLATGVVIGDMRRDHHLIQAGVLQARAVLLLSSQSTVNLEAALQVRLLNPTTQIVVRASGEERQLSDLLEQRLSGVSVVDPMHLMRWALLQALRPGDDAARFEVDGQGFAVVRGASRDARFHRPLHLDGLPPGWQVAPMVFHPGRHQASPSPVVGSRLSLWWQGLRRRRPWAELERGQRRLLLAGLGLVLVLLLGVARFSQGASWQQGVFVTLALLKGEYVDPVNVVISGQAQGARLDSWLIGGSLLVSLLGTLLTSALVAVILDRLLSVRFGMATRPRLPRHARPILLIGGERLSQSLNQELQREGHCVWPLEPGAAALHQVQRTLRDRDVLAIGMLSADLLANVEGVLALQQRWPGARMAMVASAEQAAAQLGDLLGGVTVISSLSLAADVIVATAFGERVEGVWPIDEALALQVRYTITASDNLCGRSIARLQNGYGVTAIALKRRTYGEAIVLPAVDLVLAEGDQLLVLATLEGLRRIELGHLQPPTQRLRLRLCRPLPQGALFEIHRNLARYLGCSVEQAHGLGIGSDWRELLVDPDIAELLIDNLRRLGVEHELGQAGQATSLPTGEPCPPLLLNT